MSKRHSRKREKDESNDFIVRLSESFDDWFVLLTDNVVYIGN